MAVLREWWRWFLKRRQVRRLRWIEQATMRGDLPDAQAERWKGLGGGLGGGPR